MGITASAPGMRFEETEFDEHDNSTTIRLTLDCDDDYDLYSFSPRLMLGYENTDGNDSHSSRQVALPAIHVGHNNLSEEDIERITESRG